MTKATLDDVLPEWEPFAAAVRDRRPDAGTWCEAWTVRDVVVHQAGNAEELERVLAGALGRRSVPTRSFEEREAPYHAMSDADLWSALVRRVEQLCETSDAAMQALGPETDVPWTGRTMKVAWFAEHMREELVLHGWDLTGDDATARTSLAEDWMTTHSVIAVGRPLLAKGAAALDPSDAEVVEGRLRVEGTEDVVVTATASGTNIALLEPEGEATIESDAATRCLLLWGRRPSDPSTWWSDVGPETLRRVRALLSGY
jgi:uncharacterized protein (TIGR03083 family)